MITDPEYNTVVAGSNFEMDLDDVGLWLTGEEKDLGSSRSV